MRREATPWRSWLQAAGRAGIAPGEFWRLSMSEWRALASRQDSDAMTRREFDLLAVRFGGEA